MSTSSKLLNEVVESNSFYKKKIYYYGDEGNYGTQGGNAGRGGHGGYSGLQGNIISINRKGLFNLTQSEVVPNSYGNHGKSGEPGRGGQQGDTAVKGYYSRQCNVLSGIVLGAGVFFTWGASAAGCIPVENGFYDEYSHYRTSDSYASSGLRVTEKNSNGIQKPTKNEINIDEKKNEYLKFVNKEIKSNFKNKRLLRNYHDFIKNVIITEYSSYDISFLIEQAEILLKSNNNNRHLISLQNEITKMIQNKQLSQTERSVLGYIRATLSSLIMRYNSAHEKALVINLEKYIELTFSQINNWTSLFKQNLTEVYRINYENNLKNKIKESNYQIEMLKKDIQTNQNELNKDLFRIIEEIDQLKKDVQEQDSRLINKREELSKTLRMKTLISAVQICTTMMSFLGPQTALIGSLAYAGIGALNKNSLEYLKEFQVYQDDLTNKKQSLEAYNSIKNEIIDSISARNLGAAEIQIVQSEINSNSQRYPKFYAAEKKIDEMQNMFFSQINNEINSFNNTNDLFKQLKIKERLIDLKNKIFLISDSFDGHRKVLNTINRIENGILTMIDIQNRIETYVQQNEFANYLTNIYHPSNIPVEYKAKIDLLEKCIHENIIEERYQQALDAFKYWSFPFYCEYTQVNNNFLHYNETAISSIDLKIKNYGKHLEKLLNDVKNDEALVKPSIDNHVYYRLFDKNIPFFQWSSKNYPYELKQLLRGEPTILYADVNYARFDAIKFCTLNVLIETDVPNTNKTLNELLNEFTIELTHSGESNYKYKEKTLKINMNYKSGEKLSLKYQYGLTTNANSSYKKLALNKPVLSPYTFWTVRIRAVKIEKEQELLKKIDSLLNETNIELRVFLYGHGQYVDMLAEQNNICEN